ncbi:MAG: zinc-dependent peptidase [Planctomycetes bacterium]|nr:zinc-dependent peptidase [Planctomycetota bacterium]
MLQATENETNEPHTSQAAYPNAHRLLRALGYQTSQRGVQLDVDGVQYILTPGIHQKDFWHGTHRNPRMFFSWFKNRRRRKLLAEPFPETWQSTLEHQVGHYAVLPESDQARLRDIVRILVAEKEWEGCRGLELTDEIRVTIAAMAAVLVIGFDDFYFEQVQTILVYPNEYVVKEERALAGGATLEEESDRLGEAHYRGPVILSWAEIRHNALEPGHGQNLVFHEFAHQLDMLNGAIDGTPVLPDVDLAQRWARIMDREYRRLRQAERHGRETLLDPYGASEPAEFFAVATECFFDAPRAMHAEYPELYDLFRDYYKQDPAGWLAFER